MIWFNLRTFIVQDLSNGRLKLANPSRTWIWHNHLRYGTFAPTTSQQPAKKFVVYIQNTKSNSWQSTHNRNRNSNGWYDPFLVSGLLELWRLFVLVHTNSTWQLTLCSLPQRGNKKVSFSKASTAASKSQEALMRNLKTRSLIWHLTYLTTLQKNFLKA